MGKQGKGAWRRPHQGGVAGTHWNPDQYLKFADYRLRPALELLDRVPLATPRVVYDLGCGSGHVTHLMSQRWPAATVHGLDQSSEMLAQADAEPSSVHWLKADIREWAPHEPPDLIYANATLQWLDDHAELFPRLMGYLSPGGCLAVQMPLSWDTPSHRLMRQTLECGGPDGAPIGDAAVLAALRRRWVADAEAYYDLLSPLGQRLDIWETAYLQVLTGKDPVLEWVKGTGLRPVLNGLDESDRRVFLEAYRRALRNAYPQRPSGETLYPFRRLFIVAQARGERQLRSRP